MDYTHTHILAFEALGTGNFKVPHKLQLDLRDKFWESLANTGQSTRPESEAQRVRRS